MNHIIEINAIKKLRRLKEQVEKEKRMRERLNLLHKNKELVCELKRLGYFNAEINHTVKEIVERHDRRNNY